MILTGKGAFLIAGYNTMRKEEQTKYNSKTLVKAVGVMLFASSISIIIMVGILTETIGMTILGSIIMAVIIIGGIIYINTNNRFKIKK